MISTRFAAFLAIAFLGSSASAQAPAACQPAWQPIFGGGPGPNSTVMATAVFDDGGGPALYIGGQFGRVAGVTTHQVARWDGSSWSAVGSGMDNSFGPTWVRALAVFDDGSGPALYAAGAFQYADGLPANSIARWNGSAWSALGGGLQTYGQPFFADPVSFAVFDDGSGPALILGGNFGSSPAGDSYLAKWCNPAGCGAPGSVVCEPGVGGVSACPCSNPPSGSGRGCDNSSATGGAALGAVGHSSLAHDTLVFTTSGETPSALSIVLQGNALDASGSVFGQGVRCLTGALRRLYVETASSGSITAPGAGDASVSARSAALGDTIAPGSPRHYGVYYRDPLVLGGCPATSTFDITQQLSVLWQP